MASTLNFDVAIKALDVAIAVGRYMLPMTVAFTLLSVAAGINSYSTGNIAGMVFWGVLALIGAVFAVQVIAKRREHKISRERRMQTAQKYTRVTQA